MAILDYSTLISNIDAAINDNNTGDITPADVRGQLTDIVDTMFSGLYLGTISGVDIVSPTLYDVLYFNGSSWQNISINTIMPSYAISNAIDAQFISPASGQFISWDGSYWINASPPGISGASDMDIYSSTFNGGEVVYCSGGSYINADLFTVIRDAWQNYHGTFSYGQVIRYNEYSSVEFGTIRLGDVFGTGEAYAYDSNISTIYFGNNIHFTGTTYLYDAVYLTGVPTDIMNAMDNQLWVDENGYVRRKNPT